MLWKIFVVIALLLLLDASKLQIPWFGNNTTWIFFVIMIPISLILEMIQYYARKQERKLMLFKLTEIEKWVKSIPRRED